MYLHVISITGICNKRFLGHVDFCYGDGESEDGCCELPNYSANVLENAKQGNLDGANTFGLFHYVTKNSKGEAQGIEAAEIANDDEKSIVYH